jgi:hypothetical protein
MFAVLADISSGHADGAEWLFLIAAILFLIAGVLALFQRPDPTNGGLVPFGLMLVAVAWLVL